jgi:hypothetical protein
MKKNIMILVILMSLTLFTIAMVSADTEYTFEFDPSADLSDAQSNLSSIPAVYIYTDLDEGFSLDPNDLTFPNGTVSVTAKEIWLYTPRTAQSPYSPTHINGDSFISSIYGSKITGVFYKDSSDSKVKMLGETVSTKFATITAGAGFDLNLVWEDNSPDHIDINVPDEAVNMSWGLYDVVSGSDDYGNFDSLGADASTEEPAEVTVDYIRVGEETDNQEASNGITVETPATHGASDQVVLTIPDLSVEGEACEDDANCEEGLACDLESLSCEVEEVLAAEGEACGDDADCEEGLACDLESLSCEVEEVLAAEGEACEDDTNCEEGLACDLESLSCEEEVTYTAYTFEFDSSADLSDYDTSLTSEPAIYLHILDNTIVLNPYTSSGNFIAESADLVEAKEVWFYTASDRGLLADGTAVGSQKWIAVFYKDRDTSQVELFGHVNAAGFGNEYLELYPDATGFDVKSRPGPRFRRGSMAQFVVGDEITMSWAYDARNGQFSSLGLTASTEEEKEVRIGTTGVGLEASDQTASDGIVVESPDNHGASDQVVLKVPDETSGAAAAPGVGSGWSMGTWFKQNWQAWFF